MASVAIIDYGMGNLHSIGKAVERVAGDARVFITHKAELILRADRVVFPGVGAISACIEELKRLGLDQVIMEVAATRPLLGVCLGMQALLDSSEENNGTACLGLIPGSVRKFPDLMKDRATGKSVLKIPHMGWNQVTWQKEHPLWKNIPQGSRFYFVHSYFSDPKEDIHRAATTEYGIDFTSAISRDNVFAIQCHPEKSQRVGIELLANFMRWNGEC